ncbi:uncharacterized protein RDOM_000036 [Rhyzopertha dominica]|nr:uncharacterized protein RDOM_000036 [Rhyzopertha dominica]
MRMSVKKIRNKPKPQQIDNMEEYVNNNSLEKLTTVTLRKWLKERSIHCTTRDKKADLVEKVRGHFVTAST